MTLRYSDLKAKTRIKKYIYLTNIPVAAQYRETNSINTVQISYKTNKQQQQETLSGITIKSCNKRLSKHLVFNKNKKLYDMERNKKYIPFSRKKRKRSHIWDLSSKDSQGTVQYMFKELKKFCLKN